MTTVYSLKQVADTYGFALRTLERDARANKFAHIHRGRTRLMTEEQVQALLQQSTVSPPVSTTQSSDPMEQIRAALSRSKR